MRKYLVRIIIVVILLSGMITYWKYSFTYSDGYRAGLLQKFSRKGALFKTYEGEMILSSIQSNANVTLASEKFLFSVIDKNIATQLDRLQGESIVVHYEQKNSTLPWRGESEYIVDSVRIRTDIKASPGPVK
jgi:hypothetical protein